MLTSRDIAKMLDHSTLQPFLTEKDIRHGCEVAIKYGTATVCARPQDMEIVVPMLNGTGVGGLMAARGFAPASRTICKACRQFLVLSW